LIGFFSFYLDIYDPTKHVISISSTPLFPRDTYITTLNARLEKFPHLLDTYYYDCYKTKYTFLIEDPFDYTYNPAKQVHRNTYIEEDYLDGMEQTLDSLLEEGCMLFEKQPSDKLLAFKRF
jgi:hypothetical protein